MMPSTYLKSIYQAIADFVFLNYKKIGLLLRIYDILNITMRKLLRASPFTQMARSAVPDFRPEANDQKFKNWWSRLNSLSSRPASKVYLAQLSNLFSYFNRQVTDTTKVAIIKLSLSTFPHGKAKSLLKGLSMPFKKTMSSKFLKNMTWTKSSTTFSAKILRRLIRL